MLLLWNCLLALLVFVQTEDIQKPHIVFIVADDLGWYDVSFHGSDQIQTPNIDTLAYQGVILNQYYTDSEGTSSRSALLTGKYAIRLGTQGSSIMPSEDRGIPVQERLLPSYLNEFGYTTHLVGKWDVGKSRAQYLPTNRGFDHFFGFLGNSVDYFTYNAIEQNENDTTYYGLDFFENMSANDTIDGHLTDILSEKAIKVIREHNTSVPLYLHISHAAPHIGGGLVNLQPPVDSIKANNHIAHSARRMYAGLVTSLDKSIGNVVAALAEKEILQNTLIIFVSDNGAASVGQAQNFGSNFPFRGTKSTPWEGAVRSVGIVWHSLMTSKVCDSIFHVTDWVPTLVAAAGGNLTDTIDGVNQWGTLHDDDKPKRNEVLITIDELSGWAAFREGDFKIIVGDVDRRVSGYYGKDMMESIDVVPFYEDNLLDSETSRVFRETLDLYLDVDLAFIKRSDYNKTHESFTNETTCVPRKDKGCLFNVSADPFETTDLWHDSPEIVTHMALRLRTLWTEVKPRYKPLSDARANPSLRNFVWSPWLNDNETKNEALLLVPPFPLQVSIGELQYLVDLNFNLLKDKMNMYLKNMGDTIVKSVSGLFSI